MDFSEWVKQTGETPGTLTDWFRKLHPEVLAEAKHGIALGFDSRQVASFVVANGCPETDPEKIRAALRRAGAYR